MDDLSQHPTYHSCLYKRVSWTAIFVGAFIGTGLGFLLHLFGIAIGLSAFSLTPDGATAVAIGGIIGILIGVIVSMLAAGYAAGYLGRLYCPQRNLGILYGFTTWSVALLLSAVLAAHLSQYLMNYTDDLTHSTMVTSDAGDGQSSSVAINAPVKNDKNMDKVNLSASDMAWSAATVFILFFVGAGSTCVGACWGMTCRRED